MKRPMDPQPPQGAVIRRKSVRGDLWTITRKYLNLGYCRAPYDMPQARPVFDDGRWYWVGGEEKE
jgi:hypothetical protein